MLKAIELFIYGQPKPQPRGRVRKRGGVYDPGSAEGWKVAIQAAALKVLPDEPLTGPLRVDIRFYFKRPNKFLRKKDSIDPVWHTATPDRDNLDKAVMDALTDVGMWGDDKQVCAGEVLKFYCGKSGGAAPVPCAVIRIRQLGELDHHAVVERITEEQTNG